MRISKKKTNNFVKIGILVAMESEIKGFLNALENVEVREIATKKFYLAKYLDVDLVICLSGIGKVNASIATTLLLQSFKVDVLISTGIAGGLEHSNLNQILVATKLVQHDLDTTALGDQLGLIHSVNETYIKSDEKLVDLFVNAIPGAKKGILASGDQFVCSEKRSKEIKKKFNAVACDMESCAIAQVASFYNVPFIAIRVISDSASDNADEEYEANVENSSLKVGGIVLQTLNQISQLLV